MSKELSTDRFLEIKKEVTAKEQAIKEIPISAIKVSDKSLRSGYILVNKQPVKVSPGFFKKLGSLLKINASLTKLMLEGGDTKIAASLINGLKDYQSSRKNNSVLLIANVDTKEVVDICPPNRFKRLSNETLFDVSDRILNDNSSLIVESVDYNPNGGGRTSINFLNSQEVGFAKAGPDEFFKFGFSLVQTERNTYAETYNQRLICTNGLRTSLGVGAIGGNAQISFLDKFMLGGTSSEDIHSFLQNIDAMKKAGFVPDGFDYAINKAIGTKASLFEVEQNLFAVNNKIYHEDVELQNQYRASVGHKFFHGRGEAIARINKKGADYSQLNNRQKQFIKTGMSIWDVVNSMTFLGSNNSGYPIENQHDLKQKAGSLFAKGTNDGYDLEFSQYANL